MAQEASGDTAALKAEMANSKALRAQLTQLEQEREKTVQEVAGDAAALKAEMNMTKFLKSELANVTARLVNGEPTSRCRMDTL